MDNIYKKANKQNIQDVFTDPEKIEREKALELARINALRRIQMSNIPEKNYDDSGKSPIQYEDPQPIDHVDNMAKQNMYPTNEELEKKLKLQRLLEQRRLQNQQDRDDVVETYSATE